MSEDMDDGFVHVMDDTGYPLSQVFDEQSGRYFSPITPESQREFLKSLYLTRAGASAERFDAVWPYLWQLKEFTYAEGTGLTAIVDSGVLSAHPMLHDCIRESVDFTGEGVEDRLGHGTMVTLLWRRDMPGIPAQQLIILKCVGADGRGSEANLIAALRWIRDYNVHNTPKIVCANLSLGIYNKRLGLFACNGTCRLCCEAVETAKTTMLVVAAGNTAAKTACPASAAFLASKPNIVAVTRPDEPTAGRGNVSMGLGYPDAKQAPFFTFVRNDTGGGPA